MRILAVSDLHFQAEHFAWVAKQAVNFDLVIIAGDMLDLFAFGRVSIDKQVRQVTSFLTDIRLNCNALAVCSGNHDLWATRDLRWLQLSPSRRIEEEKMGGTFIADGSSAIVPGSRLLVTCCPWAAVETAADEQRLITLLEQGEALRQNGTDAWLWVNHEPPHLSRTGRTLEKKEGSELMSRLIMKHQPDFVFGGHVHGAPFDGGLPFDQVGDTWCFNPGCPDRRKQLSEPPNIILDLDAGQTVWRWGNMEKRAYIETPVASFASAA